MLKTAYKMGKGGSVSGFPGINRTARQAGLSQTPYMKKGNDLALNQAYTGQMSPDLGFFDVEKKFERS